MDGENVTLMRQVPWAAMLLPQLLLGMKSALPLMLLMATADPVLLVTVSVCTPLVVFIGWLAKLKLAGVRASAGGGGTPMPEPLRLAICGLLLALSETANAPLIAPACVGLKK